MTLFDRLDPGWQALARGASLTCLPMQLHAVVLATFASLIAPFGGFFASGFKRGFKIKDFGDSIPGHGGMTDRMDCQVVMAVFSYVYFTSYVAPTGPSVGSVLSAAVRLTPLEQVRGGGGGKGGTPCGTGGRHLAAGLRVTPTTIQRRGGPLRFFLSFTTPFLPAGPLQPHGQCAGGCQSPALRHRGDDRHACAAKATARAVNLRRLWLALFA